MSWWRKRGLRFKLALGISITMLISLGIAFTVVSEFIQKQLWQNETQAAENLNAIVATVIKDAMMAGRKDTIQEALDNLGESIGGQIDSIAIYDDQAVLTSISTGFPGGRNIPRESLAVNVYHPTCRECHQLASEERPNLIVTTVNGKDVIRNVVPLYNEPRCQSCHGTGATILGKSIVDFRMDAYQRTVTVITIGFGVAITVAIIFVAFVLYQLLRRIVIEPVEKMVDLTRSVVQGDLSPRVEIQNDDELGQLGSSFNNMTSQIKNLFEGLEQRVAERTRDIEQRTVYLEASARVNQAATSVLEPELLIQQVVELIKERFNLYYVGLFLVDASNEWCVLQAGTGIEGQIMLERGHQIRIGEGMIGWCVANNQARIALDVGEDAIRFENPDLPLTRSEGALPLQARDRVLGALTVQSKEPSAFSQDIITVLQMMADQIAIALENAELFTRVEAALNAEKRAYGEISRQEWQKMLEQSELSVISTETVELKTAKQDWTPEMRKTVSLGEIIHQNNTIHVPIILRNQTLGVVRLRKNDKTSTWSDDEIELMDTLVDQLETALETARLYSDTQRQAARVSLTQDVADKLHRSLDIDNLMQTMLQEISNALGVSDAFIQLSTPTQASDSASSKQGLSTN